MIYVEYFLVGAMVGLAAFAAEELWRRLRRAGV